MKRYMYASFMYAILFQVIVIDTELCTEILSLNPKLHIYASLVKIIETIWESLDPHSSYGPKQPPHHQRHINKTVQYGSRDALIKIV
jgi:hypothetical protein